MHTQTHTHAHVHTHTHSDQVIYAQKNVLANQKLSDKDCPSTFCSLFLTLQDGRVEAVVLCVGHYRAHGTQLKCHFIVYFVVAV